MIHGTQSSSGTLKGLSRHESTQLDAQESVQSPRSMSSVRGTMEVAAEAFSVVGVVASCSKGAETSSTKGVLWQWTRWRQILVVIPEVPLSLRGSVEIW